MQPPWIVLVPWTIALALEMWLIITLFRQGLNRELQVFTATLVLYTSLDLIAYVAALLRFHTFQIYALRETGSSVLRTWLLIELCRNLLSAHQWTRRVTLLVLLVSAAVLIGFGFPYFLSQNARGLATSFLEMGVFFRTAYFTQVGVCAVLLLTSLQNLEQSLSRQFGIIIGLATTSSAGLVSLTLRSRPELGSPYTFVSLNYVGVITATSIWLMFMRPARSVTFDDPVPRHHSVSAD